MRKYRLLKLFGLAALTMITLVAISFLEVALYSLIFETGHDQAFYKAHAQISAPWISGIFGFMVFFLVTRFWAKKGFPGLLMLAILYPAVYLMLDLLVLLATTNVHWGSFIIIFILANGAKFAGSMIAYRLYGTA